MDDLVALLHEDIKTTMPPSPTWIEGRAANETFYRSMFGYLRPGGIRYLRTSANGGPAFAFYRPDASGGPLTIRAIQLIEIRDGAIARIDHFMLPQIFSLFGVPLALPS
jgi:RNA polymerase sigma-70 factor (ECF subfamily)